MTCASSLLRIGLAPLAAALLCGTAAGQTPSGGEGSLYDLLKAREAADAPEATPPELEAAPEPEAEPEPAPEAEGGGESVFEGVERAVEADAEMDDATASERADRNVEELMEVLERQAAGASGEAAAAEPASEPLRLPGTGLLLPVADTDFGEVPWAVDTTPYLRAGPGGTAVHLMTGFACPPVLDSDGVEGAERSVAELPFSAANGVRCKWSTRDGVLDILVLGTGRDEDPDALVAGIAEAGNGADSLEIADAEFALGPAKLSCRRGDFLPEGSGQPAAYVACQRGPVLFKAFLGGADAGALDAMGARLDALMAAQSVLAETGRACAAMAMRIADADTDTETSTGTVEADAPPLRPESVEFAPRGPVCFQTFNDAPGPDGEPLNRVVMSFPDNADTPHMWLNTDARGGLVEAVYLQHAHARAEDRDTAPESYRLVREDARGVLTVFEPAYDSIPPARDFIRAVRRAQGGEVETLATLQRNAAGGFIVER